MTITHETYEDWQRMKAQQITEGDVQRQIWDYLDTAPNVAWFGRFNSGWRGTIPFYRLKLKLPMPEGECTPEEVKAWEDSQKTRSSGFPDLAAGVIGLGTVFIEVKKPGGTQGDDQALFEQAVKLGGDVYLMPETFDEFIEMWKQVMRRHYAATD